MLSTVAGLLAWQATPCQAARLPQPDHLYGIGWMELETSLGSKTYMADGEVLKRRLMEAEQGDAFALFVLGKTYRHGDKRLGLGKNLAESQRMLKLAASKGLPEAQFLLGVQAASGNWDVPKDSVQAAAYFREAAQKDCGWAEACLGWMYELGDGVPQSQSEALKWYLRAGKHGNPWGQVSIGEFCLLGKAPGLPPGEALKWLESVAAQQSGHIKYYATLQLGKVFVRGTGVPKNYVRARQLFQEAADYGNAEAMREVGLLYEAGLGVPADQEIASSYLDEAAHRKDAEAQWRLAVRYAQGKGIPRSQKESLRWALMSADQGFPAGQCLAADMILKGEGQAADPPTAVMWLVMAADQKFSPAIQSLKHLEAKLEKVVLVKGFSLAAKRLSRQEAWSKARTQVVYDERGLPEVPASIRWLQKAARLGDAQSAFEVASWMDERRGLYRNEARQWCLAAVKQDHLEALQLLARMSRFSSSLQDDLPWLTRAAEKDVIEAQVLLGSHFRRGDKGLPQNFPEARRWLRAAAESGHPDAQTQLGEMLVHGEGGLQAAQEGLGLLKAAAETEFAPAQLLLSEVLEQGMGVEQDLVAALVWRKLSYRVPLNLGLIQEAPDRARQEALEARLTPEQHRQVAAQYQEWEQQHPIRRGPSPMRPHP